jgi:hypothetical protein
VRGRGVLVLVAVSTLSLCGAGASADTAAVSPAACRDAPELHAGESVPAWRLGAVWFTSSASGVALTDQDIECRAGSGGQQTSLRSAAWLAATTDGGTHWVIEGRAIPTEHQRYPSGERVIAVGGHTYALAANRVYLTADAGGSWSRQSAIPSPASDLVVQGRDVLAVSGRGADSPGRVTIERAASGGAGWRRVYRSVTAGDLHAQLIAASPQVLLLDLELPAGTGVASRLLVSDDRGTRWATVTLPAWDGNRCGRQVNDITAAGTGIWWLLCVGEGAGGSSAKALLETTNAGRSWTIRSAVPSLASPINEGAIPRAEPDAIVAASAERLDYAGVNGLSTSADAGKRWSAVTGVNQGGEDSDFFLLGARTGWLLAPGIGLWRTADDTSWPAAGPLNEA